MSDTTQAGAPQSEVSRTSFAGVGTDHGGRDDAERRLRAVAGQALQIIDSMPEPKGIQARYRLPWYLMVPADGGDEVDALLQAWHRGAGRPARALSRDETGCEWWLLPSLVAIRLGNQLAASGKDTEAWRVTEAALSIIARARKLLPLNGICVVVSVAELGQRERAAAAGARARAIITETVRTLRRDFPVHIIISGIDRIAGHDDFFAALPAEAGRDALGHRLDPAVRVEAIEPPIGAAFDTILERLEAVRLGILIGAPDGAKRSGIFAFVEAFAGLRDGILALGRSLLGNEAFHAAIVWRSLYFTAGAGVSPDLSHALDIAEVFFPGDAGLLQPK